MIATASSCGVDLDDVRHAWAFKVLGLPERKVASKDELEVLRKRTKDLYKRRMQEKKEPEAKKVLEAFEIMKKAVQRRLADKSGPEKKSAGAMERPGSSGAGSSRNAEDIGRSGASSSRKALGVKGSCAPGKTLDVPASGPKKSGGMAGAATPMPAGGAMMTHLPGAVGKSAPASSKESRREVRQKKANGAKAKNGAPKQEKKDFDVFRRLAASSEAPARARASAQMPSRSTSAQVCSCGQVCHLPKAPELNGGTFSCPACRVRAMDPLNIVLEGRKGVLKLAMMEQYVSKDSAQEARFKLKFNLPNLQQWRKAGHNVELRMCRLDSCDHLQVWPETLVCQVNGRKVFDVKLPLAGHKRRDVPRRISAELRSGANHLDISMRDMYSKRLALALVRTSPLLVRQVAHRVAVLSQEESKQRVSRIIWSSILESTGEEVNAAGSDRCRLVCPITLVRLETPARGHRCRHLQCFDLKAYITANSKMAAFNRRWRCPVCDIALKPPDDVFVDTHLLHILGKAEADDEEIALDSSGGWRVTAKAAPPASPSSDEERARQGEEEGDEGDDAPVALCDPYEMDDDLEVALGSPSPLVDFGDGSGASPSGGGGPTSPEACVIDEPGALAGDCAAGDLPGSTPGPLATPGQMSDEEDAESLTGNSEEGDESSESSEGEVAEPPPCQAQSPSEPAERAGAAVAADLEQAEAEAEVEARAAERDRKKRASSPVRRLPAARPARSPPAARISKKPRDTRPMKARLDNEDNEFDLYGDGMWGCDATTGGDAASAWERTASPAPDSPPPAAAAAAGGGSAKAVANDALARLWASSALGAPAGPPPAKKRKMDDSSSECMLADSD